MVARRPPPHRLEQSGGPGGRQELRRRRRIGRHPPAPERAGRRARAAERTALDAGRRQAAGSPGRIDPLPLSTFRIDPPPPPVRGPFAEPPDVEDPGGIIRSVAAKPAPLPTFDIVLFEALNEEYA